MPTAFPWARGACVLVAAAVLVSLAVAADPPAHAAVAAGAQSARTQGTLTVQLSRNEWTTVNNGFPDQSYWKTLRPAAGRRPGAGSSPLFRGPLVREHADPVADLRRDDPFRAAQHHRGMVAVVHRHAGAGVVHRGDQLVHDLEQPAWLEQRGRFADRRLRIRLLLPRARRRLRRAEHHAVGGQPANGRRRRSGCAPATSPTRTGGSSSPTPPPCRSPTTTRRTPRPG